MKFIKQNHLVKKYIILLQFEILLEKKFEKNNLYKIAKYISEIDKNAIILLDNVYVWLLKQNESVDLFKDYFQNKWLLSQTIFIESLSKTLWTTWIRLAWMWTLNKELNSFLKSNITFKSLIFKIIRWMLYKFIIWFR